MSKKVLLFFFVFVILEAFILGATLPKDKKITKNDFSDGSPQQNPNNVPIGIKQTKAYQDSVHCPDNTNNCYIPPLYTTQETGLANVVNDTFNVIDQYLNKPFTGGKIVFHTRENGTTFGGECGLGISYRMHAGVGAVLFAQVQGFGTWVKSQLSDLAPKDHYIRYDNVCIYKCVKIEYQDKVLTIPIMDETKEKKINELDVTLEAFEWLKPFPAGWTYEQKKAAGGEIIPNQITYVKCH